MKQYILLTKLMLKNTLAGMNPLRNLKDSGKKGKTAVKSVMMVLVLLFALGSVVYLEYEVYGVLRQLHQEALLPAMAFILAIVSSLVLGLFQSLSELYQGRDVTWLAVLPVKSGHIYAAKLTNLYFSDLLINIPIVIPAAVLYLLDQDAWVLPAIRLIPVFLFLPALPLAIVAALSFLLMKLSGFAKHRDQALTFLSIMFMLCYLVFCSSMGAMTGAGNGSQAMAQMITEPNGLLQKIASFFPPARWAAQGFTESFGMMALFCLVSAAGLILCYLLTSKGYLDCAVSATEQTKAAPKGNQKVSGQAVSPFRALMRLEWRDLLRTQSYLLNGVLGCLIMPVALMIGVFTGMSGQQISSDEVSTGLAEAIRQLDAGLVIAIMTAIFFLCTMVNQLPATAISREGRRYPFSLSLPVKQKIRFWAKLSVSMMLNLISMLLLCVPVLLVAPVPVPYVLAGFVLALLLSVVPAAVSMTIDARHPRLNWMTETEAMKSNFNSFFCIILWIACAAAVALIVFLLSNVSAAAMLAGLILSVVLLCIGSIYLLNRTAEKLNTLPE